MEGYRARSKPYSATECNSPHEARRDRLRGHICRGKYGSERILRGAFASQLRRMNAAGHEQSIDSQRPRATHVGAHRIADGERASVRRRGAASGSGLDQRAIVNRPMWFAGIEHLAAHGAVEIGDRSCAIDALVAALDHEVRIGAQHKEVAAAY